MGWAESPGSRREPAGMLLQASWALALSPVKWAQSQNTLRQSLPRARPRRPVRSLQLVKPCPRRLCSSDNSSKPETSPASREGPAHLHLLRTQGQRAEQAAATYKNPSRAALPGAGKRLLVSLPHALSSRSAVWVTERGRTDPRLSRRAYLL